MAYLKIGCIKQNLHEEIIFLLFKVLRDLGAGCKLMLFYLEIIWPLPVIRWLLPMRNKFGLR